LSRFYFQHRHSDDLDLFLNAHPDFKSQCQLILESFKRSNVHYEVTTASDSFLRLFAREGRVDLKIDLVNDVSFRYGDFLANDKFHRIDHWRNILSNKLCAISRLEPKDMVDILFIARNYMFSWEDLIKEAREKDLWVDPLNVCQIIDSFPKNSFDQIKWVNAWDTSALPQALSKVHDDIFYGKSNSLSSIAQYKWE